MSLDDLYRLCDECFFKKQDIEKMLDISNEDTLIKLKSMINEIPNNLYIDDGLKPIYEEILKIKCNK